MNLEAFYVYVNYVYSLQQAPKQITIEETKCALEANAVCDSVNSSQKS